MSMRFTSKHAQMACLEVSWVLGMSRGFTPKHAQTAGLGV